MYINSTRLLVLCLLLAVTATKGCDKSKCAGPIAFYESLNCTAEYDDPADSCCPTSYDCSFLDVQRQPGKCYMRNNEYSVGEKIRKEDEDVCGSDCTCKLLAHSDKNPYVHCKKITTCERYQKKAEGCYKDFTKNKCCGNIVCPKANNVATCRVGDQIYKEGTYFNPPSQPYVKCHCLPGFTGEFVEPFCSKDSCSYWKDDINIYKFRNAPIFGHSQNVASDCSVFRKSAMSEDEVVHNNVAFKVPATQKNVRTWKITLQNRRRIETGRKSERDVSVKVSVRGATST